MAVVNAGTSISHDFGRINFEEVKSEKKEGNPHDVCRGGMSNIVQR